MSNIPLPRPDGRLTDPNYFIWLGHVSTLLQPSRPEKPEGPSGFCSTTCRSRTRWGRSCRAGLDRTNAFVGCIGSKLRLARRVPG